jgi:hypothetical protein
MGLINYIAVGSLTARLLDSYLRYEVRSIRSESKIIKLTNTCPENS